jgi:glycosyltransferase involved in cell wall biosynthesis
MLVDRLLEVGGAESLVVALATNLPRDRFEVVVCTSRSAGGRQLADLDKAGIEHLNLRRRNRFDVLPFRQLARFLRERHIEIFHSHKFGSNVWAAAVQAIFRPPPVLIAQEHGWSYERRSRRLIDGKLIGRVATAFVAGTQADAERMVSREGVPASKVVVIPGAYIRRPTQPPGDVRAELGLRADAPLVATIGVLRPEKAYDVLIRALGLVRERVPDAHLVIAGDGECREELESLTKRLGLSSTVHFLGMRDDIGNVLDAADVAALSSLRESTSLFALECMAHEVPLVSTRVGGPAEFLEHGVSALLVEPGNPEALALGLETMLGDPKLRGSLAKAAREQLEGFEIEQIAARHAALYERLLDARREAITPSAGGGGQDS